MTNFTPVAALVGGALIGLAAALLMLLTGRIAGISGIVGGCVIPGARDHTWRLAFVAGMIAAPVVGAASGFSLETPQMPASWTIIVVAGLLVGFGSRLGSGCTSGHGVCGIARFSLRSIVATVIFMFTAFVVVFVVRHGG